MNLTPQQLAIIAVNTGVHRQVLQHICNMVNIQIAFSEEGTALVSNRVGPMLLTRDMGHALVSAVQSENWHTYTVEVKRTTEGVFVGDEKLTDMGAAQ